MGACGEGTYLALGPGERSGWREERGIEEVRRTEERGMFEEDQAGGCRGAAWRWVLGDDIRSEDRPI